MDAKPPDDQLVLLFLLRGFMFLPARGDVVAIDRHRLIYSRHTIWGKRSSNHD